MRRLTTSFGPEWHPVLVVLAVLASLVVLASLHWWLGLAGLAAVLGAYLVAVRS